MRHKAEESVCMQSRRGGQRRGNSFCCLGLTPKITSMLSVPAVREQNIDCFVFFLTLPHLISLPERAGMQKSV